MISAKIGRHPFGCRPFFVALRHCEVQSNPAFFCIFAPKLLFMTIKEIQDSIVEDFSMFDDWMDRY
ncbi:MAG: hypothetical protein II078_01220, partial [Muribaculaceae bacterium]|nr:hypothetical protein [Muribaculaceae bacterium]